MLLRSLELGDELEAISAHEELAADNFTFLLDYKSGMLWSEYVAFIKHLKEGEQLPEGYVPSNFLVADQDSQIIGRTSIRYELNDFLFTRGGHIGYAVRPAYRNKGFAKEILQLSLIHLKDTGVDKALVTCNDDNSFSAKVIEFCGGIMENKVEYEEKVTRRYWIDLNSI